MDRHFEPLVEMLIVQVMDAVHRARRSSHVGNVRGCAQRAK
jgi:hypothetical protein